MLFRAYRHPWVLRITWLPMPGQPAAAKSGRSSIRSADTPQAGIAGHGHRHVREVSRPRPITDSDRRFLLCLGAQLREAREAKGLTIEQLAWQAEIDHGYLSRIESGSRAPSLMLLRHLATQLDLRLGELIGVAEAGLTTEPTLVGKG